MSVDASCVCGLSATWEALPIEWSYYSDKGLILPNPSFRNEEGEMMDDGVHKLCCALHKAFPSCHFEYTYGYQESEIYCFVHGDSFDDLAANIDGYLDAMAKLGTEPLKREDISIRAITFMS